MKAIHLIPRIVPSPEGVIVGGSVNSLFNLINIKISGIEHFIYTQTDSGMKERFKRVKLQNGEIYAEENIMPPGTFLYAAYFFVKTLFTLVKKRAWGADIINGHSGFVPYALLTGIAGKILKKPSVHSLYCPIYINKKNKIFSFIVSKIYYFSLILNDKVAVMSENIKLSLTKIGIPENKIIIARSLIDIEKFNPRNKASHIKKDLGCMDDEPLVLYVGNLKSSKGLDVLIEALGVLAQQGEKFRFVYTLELKERDYEKRYEEMSRRINALNIGDRITRLGIISYMPALMASVDLIVVPYRDTDGPSDYPVALMEAMASGTPAIGTKVGGITELIENNVTGLLVEPEDMQGLAVAIRKLIRDPSLRAEYGKNARNICEERLSPKKITDEMQKIYADMLKCSKGK